MTAVRSQDMAATDDDATVIERSRADPEAFAAIFDRHAAAVYRFLARRSGEQLAEDLTGQTMLRAFDKRQGFDSTRRDCLPWLYGIANNLLREHRKGEARRYRALARIGLPRPTDDHADAVSEKVSANATAHTLAPELGKLASRERDILLLVVWERLSYEEVAHALDIPVGTVRSRVHRARAKLRGALGESDPSSANRTEEQGDE